MDRLWTRPDTFRLLARVDGLVLDGDGNARTGVVRFLDKSPDGLAWHRWEVGRCLHWSPFRVALLSTRRAGLHIICEWADATGAMRYAQNHHLSADGILVIRPCDAVALAETIDSALADDVERAHLDRALQVRLGLNATDTRPTRRLWRLPLVDPAEPGHWALHPLAQRAAA